jgi:hypothetical protein
MSSLAMIFSLILAGCPLETNSASSAVSDTVVNAANLSGLVEAPVKWTQPLFTPVDTAQYTGPVVWKDLADNAVTGEFYVAASYKAIVILTAKPGFTFQGIGADFFQYRGAVSVKNAANSGTVTITFPPTAAAGRNTAVNRLDLTSLITQPVTGAAPQASIPDQPQYTGAITWQTETGGAVSGNFAASAVYKALVTLTALPSRE